MYFGTKNAILRTQLVRKVWIFRFRPSGLHYCRVIGLFGIWGIKQGFPNSRRCPTAAWGPVRGPLCIHGPCRTPAPGQYSDGEPQRADIGSGRYGMAGAADLGALGGFWKRRPAFAARATHSGTKPALSQARPGPARRCMWAMADCTRHEDFMRVY